MTQLTNKAQSTSSELHCTTADKLQLVVSHNCTLISSVWLLEHINMLKTTSYFSNVTYSNSLSYYQLVSNVTNS